MTIALSEIALRDQILVAVLAATDAVFIPDRDPLTHPRHVVIYERRRDFGHSGVPWSSERVLAGMDEAGRKQVQRILEELALDDLVLTFQPKGAKTLGVRLSDAGDARARALAGLPALAEALALIRMMADLEQTGAARAGRGRTWLPETALAGVRWGDHERRHELVAVEEKLLPALVRGWAQSNCSVRGHCWYAVTELGREQLGKSIAESADIPEACDWARREYYYRLQQELLALAATKPNCEREIGEIPMAVCAG